MSAETSRKIYDFAIVREDHEHERSREKERQPSRDHNITVSISETGEMMARQINNRVTLSESEAYVADFAQNNSLSYFNIPPSSIGLMDERILTPDSIIPNPVPVVFISSYGLLNGSEWTSSQPSEGTAVLSEWLARNEPQSAPIFIDPNLISEEEFEDILSRYAGPESPSLIGFSLLPVNLRNDIPLIARTKQKLPKSIMVAGGIGSEILDLLPTASGAKGVGEALPIDTVLTGTPFGTLSQIVKGLHSGTISNKQDLDELLQATDARPYPVSEIQDARVRARNLFIPYEYTDLVHGKSYKEANELSEGSEGRNVVSVLIDNRCDQGCYFCSSPKQQIYTNIESAMDHLEAKVQSAEIIAVNDNDLSNNPDQTIALCQEMIGRGILQPKHGKMRANSYHPELLDALAKANFVRLAIGVESFDYDVRKSLNKKDFTDDAIEKNLHHMLLRGIQPEINLILFSPHETNESLEKTVRDSLNWVNEGCSLYATIGLFAVPNAPAVKNILRKGKLLESQLIETEELFYPGMKEALLFPTRWKGPNDESAKLRDELLTTRKEILDELSTRYDTAMPIPVEAYTAIALLANRLGLEGFVTKEELLANILEYAESQLDKHYISI